MDGWASSQRHVGDGDDGMAATAGAVGRRAAAAEPLRFFPFSQGPRDCVGQSLARLNYTATLAALLGRFTFRLVPGVRHQLLAWRCSPAWLSLPTVLATKSARQVVDTILRPHGCSDA